MSGQTPQRTNKRSVANYAERSTPKTRSVTRILAVVRVGECGRFAFVSPDLFPGSLGMLQEIGIPIFKVSVDCRLRGIHRLIITVVDDRMCHAAEDRFDHIQELSTGRQWCGLDQRTTSIDHNQVVSLDAREKLLRDVP